MQNEIQNERPYCPPYSAHEYGNNEHGGIKTRSGYLFIFDRPLFRRGDEYLEFVVYSTFDGGFDIYRRGDTEDHQNLVFFEVKCENQSALNDYMVSLCDLLESKGFKKAFELI